MFASDKKGKSSRLNIHFVGHLEGLEARQLMAADVAIAQMGPEPAAIVDQVVIFANNDDSQAGTSQDATTEVDALRSAKQHLQLDHMVIDLELTHACNSIADAENALKDAEKARDEAKEDVERSDDELLKDYQKRVRQVARKRSAAFRKLLNIQRRIRSLMQEKVETNEAFAGTKDPFEIKIRDRINGRTDLKLAYAAQRETAAQAAYDKCKDEWNELITLGRRGERKEEAIRRQRAAYNQVFLQADSKVAEARRNLESAKTTCDLLRLELRYNESNQDDVDIQLAAAEERERVLRANQPSPGDTPETLILKAIRLEHQADKDIADNNWQPSSLYHEAVARAARADNAAAEAGAREQAARQKAQQHQDNVNSGADRNAALAADFDRDNPGNAEGLTQAEKADRQRQAESKRAREQNMAADEAAHEKHLAETAAGVSRRQATHMEQGHQAQQHRLEDARNRKGEAEQLRRDAEQVLEQQRLEEEQRRREEREEDRRQHEEQRNQPCIIEMQGDVLLGGNADLSGVKGSDVRRRLAAKFRQSNNDMINSLGIAMGFEQAHDAAEELAGLGVDAAIGGIIDSVSTILVGTVPGGALAGTAIQTIGDSVLDMARNGVLEFAGWSKAQLAGERFTMNGTTINGTATTVVNKETGQHVTEINFHYRETADHQPKQVKLIVAGSVGFLRNQ